MGVIDLYMIVICIISAVLIVDYILTTLTKKLLVEIGVDDFLLGLPRLLSFVFYYYKSATGTHESRIRQYNEFH